MTKQLQDITERLKNSIFIASRASGKTQFAKDVADLIALAEKQQAALNWYADEENYTHISYSMPYSRISEDGGEIARQALGSDIDG